MTLFERLGGEEELRAIVERFVDRIFDDFMIGFHFRDASRARIQAKEYEFAAQHLGADVFRRRTGPERRFQLAASLVPVPANRHLEHTTAQHRRSPMIGP